MYWRLFILQTSILVAFELESSVYRCSVFAALHSICDMCEFFHASMFIIISYICELNIWTCLPWQKHLFHYMILNFHECVASRDLSVFFDIYNFICNEWRQCYLKSGAVVLNSFGSHFSAERIAQQWKQIKKSKECVYSAMAALLWKRAFIFDL